MTAEEEARMQYNAEQKKYYNLCTEIQNLQNKLSELQAQRQKKFSELDEKQNEIKRNNDLYESVNNLNGFQDAFDENNRKISNSMEEAGNNFKNMVDASNIKSKNPFNVESKECKLAPPYNSFCGTSQIIEEIKKSAWYIRNKGKILEEELKKINQEIDEIENQMKVIQFEIRQREQDKQRALTNMAYYKKLMQQIQMQQMQPQPLF